MPLHMKCATCGQLLVLDEAFAGAHCRCQHCRSLLLVPGDPPSSAGRSSQRPPRPALASEISTRPRVVAAQPSAVSISHAAAAPDRRNAFAARFLTPSRLSAAFALLAVAAIIPALYYSSPDNKPAVVRQITARQNEIARLARGNEEVAALLTNDPLTHYFGQPLSGTTIGFVVDCDEAMSPFIERVADYTNYFSTHVSSASKRIGIVQAMADGRQTLFEVMEPRSDLLGARPKVTPRTASGPTNLSAALARTSSWYADRIFLVLAKPVEAADVELLARTAEQTGAVVNVVAFGSAASQKNLAAVANATGGKFIPVQDEVFDRLLQRQFTAQQAL